MFSPLLSDATPVFLLSPWKPILIVATFIAWGWLVSTHLEKDARTARLNPTKWNGIHICAAFIALCVMLFGINFYLAFPIGFVVLLAPILVYWKIRNEAVIEERKFKIGSDTIKSAIDTRKRTRASRQVSMHFDGNNGSIQVPKKDDPLLEIYLIADELITDALLNRASRLEFRLTSKGCQSVYFTDGMPVKQEPIAVDAGAKVLAFLKEAAGTDPNDVRRRQTGAFDAASDQVRTHIDLTSSGSSNSHTVRLDFNRSQGVLRDWNTIGMLPKQRELLDQLTQEDKRHGILLIGGDKQSGLTTTGYAILSQHDSYLSNIVTIEQEIYASLEGITHSCVHDQEADYATQLQTLIRRDPEVILAADLIDAEAAKNATKPGKEGPLIIVGVKASSMPELISRWAGFVSDPRKSFDSLQAVVYQKLVRKLCENCRVAYKPSKDLAKHGLPIDTVEQLYRKGGQVELKNKIVTCPICNGSGYLGQVGVFETMFLDGATRKHLVAGDLKAAMAHAKRNKCYIRLQEAAWYKVAAGETSLEEFGRVNRKRTSKKKVTKAK
ncbi:MAG: Flp pilus assembly complex ATPase component TadA [Phycisphaerales bacterium]|nr:Flp pilus assembly complex ATPase component TadA [Planctomycetota bacterium]MBL6997893.1 Flp pilus assembly complex ATPase component TadA [Phycisphaerales bacterium]